MFSTLSEVLDPCLKFYKQLLPEIKRVTRDIDLDPCAKLIPINPQALQVIERFDILFSACNKKKSLVLSSSIKAAIIEVQN